jgi:hypothetical protein
MPAKKLTKMKRIIILLASFLLLFLLVVLSCDKSELQEQTGNKIANEHSEVVNPNTDWIDGTLQSRADSCADCPIDDCCCAIQIVATGSADINLCGTSDGTDNCGPADPGSPCLSSVSGGGQTFTLDYTTAPRHLFCMDKNATFWVSNLEDYSVDLWLSCQHDLTTPQSVQFSLAGGTTFFFNTNSSCVVDTCAIH